MSVSVAAVDKPLRSILCMLLAVVLFSARDAVMKSLTPYYSAIKLPACVVLWPAPLMEPPFATGLLRPDVSVSAAKRQYAGIDEW